MKSLKIWYAIALLVSGCSTTKSVSNLEMDRGQTATFKIPATIIGGDSTRLTSEYAKAMVRASSYRTLYWERDISFGVRVNSSIDNATISYVHQNDRGTLKNNYSALFSLNISKSDDTYSVAVNCPSNVVNDLSELSGLSWSPFISKEKVVADITSICRRAEFILPITESGEINTAFNDSSVFSNFTRKLKSYSPRNEEVKQYDLEKSKWFYLADGNKEYKIAVTVFPYRNGSKVTYRNVRDVTCKASQPCDFDAGFSSRLRSKIMEIAND